MNWLGIAYSLIGMTFGRALSLGGSPNTNLVGARVSYRQGGRSGSVVFSQGLRSFELYFEFGGGDVVACIDIPTASEWQQRTGFPIDMRQSILDFVGGRVVRDQVSLSRGRYEIHDDHILIKSGPMGERA